MRFKPQLSASEGDIFHGFFYLQHVQSCRIEDTKNFHRPHSKRKLDKIQMKIKKSQSQQISTKRKRENHREKKKEKEQEKENENCI